jgi:NADPH-dependent 7-cyano-7-deazaguanine reductase QueF
MKYGEKEIKEAKLETWENPFPERNYTVEITFPEFSCLCPRSGYPDYATIRIEYVPDGRIEKAPGVRGFPSPRERENHHQSVLGRSTAGGGY